MGQSEEDGAEALSALKASPCGRCGHDEDEHDEHGRHGIKPCDWRSANYYNTSISGDQRHHCTCFAYYPKGGIDPVFPNRPVDR
jgi:hypothetical protein